MTAASSYNVPLVAGVAGGGGLLVLVVIVLALVARSRRLAADEEDKRAIARMRAFSAQPQFYAAPAGMEAAVQIAPPPRSEPQMQAGGLQAGQFIVRMDQQTAAPSENSNYYY